MSNFKIGFFILFIIYEFGSCREVNINHFLDNCESEFDESLMRTYKLCKNVTLNSNVYLTGEPYEYVDIRFINCTIPSLTASIAKLFKGTRHIQFKNCLINTVDNEFSEKLSHYLYSLKLSENIIEELPINCLGYEEKLELLDLSKNRLRILPETVFKSLASLRELYLQQNKIRELNPKLFEYLDKMEIIDLSNNEIFFIPDGIFLQNFDLKKILLVNNRIKVFADNLTEKINHLKLLDVSYNPLTLFNFSNAETVKATNTELQICNIKSLVTNVYANNSKISKIIINTDVEKLFLCNNSLTEFRNITENEENFVREITHVDLSMNNIKGKSINLSNMLNLRFLNLSNIKISNNKNSDDGNYDLDTNVFANAHKLELLDLSRNNLTKLNTNLLHPVINLKYLYLSDNNLKSIEYTDVDLIKAGLKEIDLQNNQWNCSYLIKMIEYFVLKQIIVRYIDSNSFLNSQYDDLLSNVGCSKDEEFLKMLKVNQTFTTDYPAKSIVKTEENNDKNNNLNAVINLLITLIFFVIIIFILLTLSMYYIWKKISSRSTLEIHNPLIELNDNGNSI